MRKRTLHDKITLYLAERGDWVPSYELSRRETKWGWIGSSGERRARELAEGGEHLLDGMVYIMERRMHGKYVEYRVASIAPKKPKFAYVERDGAMVEVAL